MAPTQGLIKLFTPQTGILIERRVAEGQEVQQGEVLLVISSERSTVTTTDAQGAMLRELSQRRDSLKREQAIQADIDALTTDDLTQRIQGFKAERAQAQAQFALQQSRVSSVERTIRRHEALASTHFVSEAAVQQTQESLLDQRIALTTIERTITELTRDLGSAERELVSSRLQRVNRTAAFQRQISELEQQITEADMHRTMVLTAAAPGTVTTLLTDVGQTVHPNTPLLSILPEGAVLEAQLLVPTRAAGFNRPGQTVAFSYPAFPYQRFGHYLGKVLEVGRTVIQPNESNLPLALSEPVYRVTVRLPTQQVQAYSQTMPLQAGMGVEADIWVDRRSILEWLVDPLLSVTGRL
ncbi:MAG TPA: hypothetical protein DCS21_11495 [Gammaproteobacteria bacterium]|nr:hypothetical protein [Gammaproteobacteria bacterium]